VKSHLSHLDLCSKEQFAARGSSGGRKGWHREDLAGGLNSLLDMQRLKENSKMKKDRRGFNLASKPSGDGCVECLASPKDPNDLLGAMVGVFNVASGALLASNHRLT
jgi:hypothetical protein